jgi:LmbE family N-acetylglucosaminyl deacetylase
VILTGGTLARAVTAGHRVVVVTATDPCAAISSSDSAKATVESASGAAPLVVS